MEKSNTGKKRITLKEIGLPRLLLLLAAGLALLFLSLPSGGKSGNANNQTGQAGTSGSGTGIGTLFSGDETADIRESAGQSADSVLKNTEAIIEKMEERLAALLRKVKGIGDVEVMITLKSSPETIVLKDAPYTSESTAELDGSGGERTIVKREQGEETILTEEGYPYVIKQTEPEVEGVVVLAKGAADRTLVSEIIEAVEVLFGVPAHKVKVMKME